MMVVVSNFVLILKIYDTLSILVIHIDFEGFDSFKHNSQGFNNSGVH